MQVHLVGGNLLKLSYFKSENLFIERGFKNVGKLKRNVCNSISFPNSFFELELDLIETARCPRKNVLSLKEVLVF